MNQEDFLKEKQTNLHEVLAFSEGNIVQLYESPNGQIDI